MIQTTATATQSSGVRALLLDLKRWNWPLSLADRFVRDTLTLIPSLYSPRQSLLRAMRHDEIIERESEPLRVIELHADPSCKGTVEHVVEALEDSSSPDYPEHVESSENVDRQNPSSRDDRSGPDIESFQFIEHGSYRRSSS